jgi:hypothetical protein
MSLRQQLREEAIQADPDLKLLFEKINEVYCKYEVVIFQFEPVNQKEKADKARLEIEKKALDDARTLLNGQVNMLVMEKQHFAEGKKKLASVSTLFHPEVKKAKEMSDNIEKKRSDEFKDQRQQCKHVITRAQHFLDKAIKDYPMLASRERRGPAV